MKIFIIDSSEIFLERISCMLSELMRIEIVGIARNFGEAKTALSRLTPDVMIMDTRVCNGSSTEIIEIAKQGNPEVRVIALAEDYYPQYKRVCIDIGIEFIFHKLDEIDNLLKLLQNNFFLEGKKI